ncbi:uncharacterized protein LOC131876805 isoform X2 [Tigriopus californicus]|nr:uncharacterized protein LOC131876805 isoform X2 [Tigriopus californicus]
MGIHVNRVIDTQRLMKNDQDQHHIFPNDPNPTRFGLGHVSQLLFGSNYKPFTLGERKQIQHRVPTHLSHHLYEWPKSIRKFERFCLSYLVNDAVMPLALILTWITSINPFATTTNSAINQLREQYLVPVAQEPSLPPARYFTPEEMDDEEDEFVNTLNEIRLILADINPHPVPKTPGVNMDWDDQMLNLNDLLHQPVPKPTIEGLPDAMIQPSQKASRRRSTKKLHFFANPRKNPSYRIPRALKHEVVWKNACFACASQHHTIATCQHLSNKTSCGYEFCKKALPHVILGCQTLNSRCGL